MFDKPKIEALTHERIKADFEVQYNERLPKLKRRFAFFGILSTVALLPFILISVFSKDGFAAVVLSLMLNPGMIIGFAHLFWICWYFIHQINTMKRHREIINSKEYRITTDGPIKVKGRDRRWLYLVVFLSWPALIFFFLEPSPCKFYFSYFGKYSPPIGIHYGSSKELKTTDEGLTHFTNNLFYVVNYGDKRVISIYNQGLFDYKEEAPNEE